MRGCISSLFILMLIGCDSRSQVAATNEARGNQIIAALEMQSGEKGDTATYLGRVVVPFGHVATRAQAGGAPGCAFWATA